MAMIRTRLDPARREARYNRVAVANKLAVKAMRVGRGSPLGLAYSAAVVGLERLRKDPSLTGAQKDVWAQRIHDRVLEHEEKTLKEAEESLAANVAISRHAAALKQMREERP